uniref:THO complex subunit 2 N-terminal domain-containing protein n=1 Tax=Ditylenchus dipsaci TaxID=166011 RepID=A0A915DWV3_9BILA
MGDEIIEQLLLCVRNCIAEKIPCDEAIGKLRTILSGNSDAVSALLDVLTALNSELGDTKENSETFKLLSALIDEVLPAEVLSLELNALGAEEKQTKSKIVKSKTRIYYKQIKFNLLREESEGYAKLITEILSVQPTTSSDEVLLTIERLIGQFNLDPNRVLDIILDGFENNLDELRDILLLKFVFCEKSEYTTMDLYRVASILCQEDLVDIRSLFNMISPTQNHIVEENKRLIELVKKRAAKAEIISTGSLADSSLTTASSAMLANNEGPERMEAVVVSAVSFGAASQSQVMEDAKLAGSSFDDLDVLPRNQKLGLLCALLEHGSWAMAKQLLDRLPEGYPTGVRKRFTRRISAAIANIIGYSIEPFYKQKYSNWRNEPVRGRDSWKRFTAPVEQMNKWEDLTSLVYPLITYIGPYICVRHEVAIKLIRLILAFLDDEAAKESPAFDSLNILIMDMCDGALVPAAHCSNPTLLIVKSCGRFFNGFLHDRYRIYGRWKNVHTARCWALNVQRGKVLGMTRYAMKRLSKDTAKVVGRQLGSFVTPIRPVVDSMRFLSILNSMFCHIV